MEQYVQNGEKLFRSMYRETADKVQGLLDEIYPDMGQSFKLSIVAHRITDNELTRLVLKGDRIWSHVRPAVDRLACRDVVRDRRSSDRDGHAAPD